MTARHSAGVSSARSHAGGSLVGTAELAALPALMAATSPEAEGGELYGPTGPGHAGGAPGVQRLYRPLRSPEEAARVWRWTQEQTGVAFPG